VHHRDRERHADRVDAPAAEQEQPLPCVRRRVAPEPADPFPSRRGDEHAPLTVRSLELDHVHAGTVGVVADAGSARATPGGPLRSVVVERLTSAGPWKIETNTQDPPAAGSCTIGCPGGTWSTRRDRRRCRSRTGGPRAPRSSARPCAGAASRQARPGTARGSAPHRRRDPRTAAASRCPGRRSPDATAASRPTVGPRGPRGPDVGPFPHSAAVAA
jgi:hypothetical protein